MQEKTNPDKQIQGGGGWKIQKRKMMDKKAGVENDGKGK